MYEIFKSVINLTKISRIYIDNMVFRLHYKATVILLMAFSILVTCRQYIGDPIDCIVDEGVPQHVMDTFCWVYSTYTIPNLNGVVGKSLVAPGVSSGSFNPEEIKYHKYYQWVCFTLFFQAILFYIPRYLWKAWEGGKIKTIMLDLGNPVVKSNKDTKNSCRILTEYFMKNLHLQNFYIIRYFICEILNFVNVITQMFFMDFFLGGEFSTYGVDVIKYSEMDPEDRIDPMSRVFPKVTKCLFRKYGSSGSIEEFDGLCVLPLNIVNEKIYVFLWFWFIILAILSGLNLIYRTAVVCGPTKIRDLLLRSRARLSNRNQINKIVKMFSIGDWFVLYQLGKNMDPVIFNQLISDLSNRFVKNDCDEDNYKLRSISIKK